MKDNFVIYLVLPKYYLYEKKDYDYDIEKLYDHIFDNEDFFDYGIKEGNIFENNDLFIVILSIFNYQEKLSTYKGDLILLPEADIIKDNLKNILETFYKNLPNPDKASSIGYIDHERHTSQLYYRSKDSYMNYIKHSAASRLAYENENWSIENNLKPFEQDGWKIGNTICHDMYFPSLMRTLRKQGADVLLNPTGGGVNKKKWNDCLRIRAIENQAYTLCTMNERAINSKTSVNNVIGYDPFGNPLKFEVVIHSDNNYSPGQFVTSEETTPGGIYKVILEKAIIETARSKSYFQLITNKKDLFCDPYAEQDKSVSKKNDIFINLGNKNNNSEISILQSDKGLIFEGKYKSTKVSDYHYIIKYKDTNLVFINIQNDEILLPEKVESCLYDEKLHNYDNKIYFLVNSWNKLSENLYERVILNILRQRTVENYVITICLSSEIQEVLQCGTNKTVQRVAYKENHGFGIELKRMSRGPEALWKDSSLAKLKAHRGKYEQLLKYCNENRIN